MNVTIFEAVLILLVLSISTSILFKKLNIPVIVGYIAVGMMVGPYSVGILVDNKDVRDLAEFGLVFLMFSIGLEFSFIKLMKMKRSVFAFGGLEVLLATLITVAIGVNLWLSLPQAIIMGGIVAMSSTAIVTKQLADQIEINLPHGIHSVGILLFQDLAVIPFLILIPSLASSSETSLYTEIGGALLKALGAMLLIFFLGRKVLRPVFYGIAKMHSLELFTLTTILVTLSAAWLTHELGLSMPLGAFMAGMMLGDTEFRHQIETDIRPFKDVLMGFFFITIGMQFDAHVVVEAWQWILLLFFALLVFKTALIWSIGRLMKARNMTSLRTGLILAHGGEFGVAILSLAMSYTLLPDDYAQVTLAAILLSMMVAPIVIRYNCKLSTWILPKAKPTLSSAHEQVEALASSLENHVIVGGYGRVGQNIARFLEKAEIPFVAFDLDPNRVKQAQTAGDMVFYADITHHDIFEVANLSKAKALVLSFYNTHASIKILEQVRMHDKKLTIIARAHDEQEASMLIEKGATEVIPETLEASLMLASHILLFMKVNPQLVNQLIEKSRHNRYDLLRMVFPGEDSGTIEHFDDDHAHLSVVELGENAYAIGKSIEMLNLATFGVKVATIRRGKIRIKDPAPSTKFAAHDIVIIYGPTRTLDRAELCLIEGSGLID